MLTLHGSSHSNYYNKVKLALLEKDVPFTEVHAARTAPTRRSWRPHRWARFHS